MLAEVFIYNKSFAFYINKLFDRSSRKCKLGELSWAYEGIDYKTIVVIHDYESQ